MTTNRLLIKEFLSRSGDAVIIDVRSPSEYSHAHIPGAINLPLFTDEERKVVGTTYKQQSREQAIKVGLDYFGPKMRKMVEEVEALIGNRQLAIGNKQSAKGKGQKAKDVEIHGGAREMTTSDCQLPIAPAFAEGTSGKHCLLVYCWRGGMRSAAVAWLLGLYGFKVYTLAGGYKSFRNYVLQSFEQPYKFQILGGYTGSGKTEVLQELRNIGEPVIDLEKAALHKGSAFGNINMPPQPTQEMFENILATELRALNPGMDASAVWLEDESQRIGNVNIPNALWEQMRQSPVYFLEIPFEERLNHVVEEYGALPGERLADAIVRISKRLGGLETKNALQFLGEGDIRECFRILLSYYDRRYLKGLNNREQLNSLLTKLDCHSVCAGNAVRLKQAASEANFSHTN